DIATARRRLELRDHRTSLAFARGAWVPGPHGITPGFAIWGRLRAHLTNGGIDAVIVDRSGRILMREALDPALSGAPALGLEPARRRWEAVVGNREKQCLE